MTQKFTSFADLSKAVNGDINSPDKWADFLKEKGHTEDTFSYLPESLKTDLKFSFLKKKL